MSRIAFKNYSEKAFLKLVKAACGQGMTLAQFATWFLREQPHVWFPAGKMIETRPGVWQEESTQAVAERLILAKIRDCKGRLDTLANYYRQQNDHAGQVMLAEFRAQIRVMTGLREEIKPETNDVNVKRAVSGLALVKTMEDIAYDELAAEEEAKRKAAKLTATAADAADAAV